MEDKSDSAPDLIALDRRRFAHSIAEELKRISSSPLDLSIVHNAKAIAEAQLKYYADLLAVATPEETPWLEGQVAQYKERLERFTDELAARRAEIVPEASPAPIAATELTNPRAQQIRRRGAPSKFSDAQIDAALAAEASGKNRAQVARILYKTDTPLPAQRRSVSVILNYHRKRRALKKINS